MRTDAAPLPFKYDPIVGKAAFGRRHAALNAMSSGLVQIPNCDAQMAAGAAVMFVKAARSPEGEGLLESEAAKFFLKDSSVERLLEEAWTLSYLDERATTADAGTPVVKVDPKLVAEAMEARTRALDLLSYFLKSNASMMAELQDIRSGLGFWDLQKDVSRLATHVENYEAVVSVDTVNYRPGDVARLRGLAGELLNQLTNESKNETADLRNRAFTAMSRTYSTLKLCADLAYRDNPKLLDRFPALRTGAVALAGRTRSPKETLEDAPVPAAGGTTPAAPVVTAPATGNAPTITTGLATESPFQNK